MSGVQSMNLKVECPESYPKIFGRRYARILENPDDVTRRPKIK